MFFLVQFECKIELTEETSLLTDLENLHFENEIEWLRSRHEHLQVENERLRVENERLHAENERLRIENERLEALNERLEAKLRHLQTLTVEYKQQICAQNERLEVRIRQLKSERMNLFRSITAFILTGFILLGAEIFSRSYW